MKTIWIITIAAILFVAGCQTETETEFQVTQEDNIEGAVTGTDGEQLPDVPAESASGFTLAEVAKHATEDDCWLAIEGRVYDVSSFIAGHPGGEAILEGCGRDATGLFRTRPMGSGTPHSPRAEMMLEGYFIGMLDG